jgi:DNA invertase Pin-like site-specific DNA recombinase
LGSGCLCAKRGVSAWSSLTVGFAAKGGEVSTTEQTTTNQRRELQAVAKRHGWSVVQVFEDAGISGAKGRKDRPALDALLKSVARREVDMVAAWSVDRLGRSLTDLLDFLRELRAKGVDLFLHQQGLDTPHRLVGQCFR